MGAPVAVKTVKYAAPTVKYVAPTVKTVQYAAPYAYQYGAYPYAAAYQPYAVKSLLPATYGAYPYGAYPYGAYPYGYAVAAEEKKNRFPQLFQSYTRSTTSRIFTTNQTYQHEKKIFFLTFNSSINCIDYALTSLMDKKKIKVSSTKKKKKKIFNPKKKKKKKKKS